MKRILIVLNESHIPQHVIRKAIGIGRKINSLLSIMFTGQNRSLFQNILLASKPAEYSFNAKVRLIVCNKSY